MWFGCANKGKGQARTGNITEEEVAPSSSGCVASDVFASVLVRSVEAGTEDRLADCDDVKKKQFKDKEVQ